MTTSEAKDLCCGRIAVRSNRFMSKAKYLKMKSETLSKMMNCKNTNVSALYSSLFRVGDSVFSCN